MSTSEEAGLPDPATAASSLVDCRLPGREGCEPLHSSSPLSSHLHGGSGRGPLRQYNATLHCLPHPFSMPLTSPRCQDGESKSSSLGTKATTAEGMGYGKVRRRRQQGTNYGKVCECKGEANFIFQMEHASHVKLSSSAFILGVQMGNEQRCQKEIEDTKHGLESGSITYDPAKLKFSDDIKDSR
uniref:p0660F12.3 protein n=1 Tax=Oryza sativa subsp. japonica TaxID=39947 RepID=Q94CS2_ORYSJ|nr:P0660F12.3 [Oryza sativa Japonica Group]